MNEIAKELANLNHLVYWGMIGVAAAYFCDTHASASEEYRKNGDDSRELLNGIAALGFLVLMCVAFCKFTF